MYEYVFTSKTKMWVFLKLELSEITRQILNTVVFLFSCSFERG